MTDTRESTSPESGDGEIVTFYSYKGGTGRTMALANVAWILAANGKRVLVADWDLESPGLHRFFHPFLDTEVREAPGVIDLIRGYEWSAVGNGPRREEAQDDDESLPGDTSEAAARRRSEPLIRDSARVQHYAFSLNWDFPDGGGLDFLSSGRQNSDYAAALSALDWENFYDRLNGAQFFDALRADMKRHYDYVLIDSRTGLSDVADICTVHLPDVLVDCFTLSTQGIEGAAQVARIIQERYAGRGIRILPVPMRVDQAEKEKVDAGHAVAVRLFSGLPAGMPDSQRREYWAAVEVPYRAFYAYEETLAVFGDVPGSPTSLLASFERIAAQITDGAIDALPAMEESLRLRTKLLFTRRAPSETDKIVIDCGPEDQVWAEWITGILGSAGLPIHDRSAAEAAPWEADGEERPRVLAVISSAYVIRARNSPMADPPSMAVYVSDTRPLPQFATTSAAFLAGLPEHEAVERLLRLFGIAGGPRSDMAQMPGIRYPGTEPRISNAPARNLRFTGRENDLRQLRDELRTRGTAVVLPLTLQGLGGVGKTQVALEYVHRFKTDYDLVWWVNCGQPQFIDASLADLGGRMQEIFNAGAPAGATVAEIAREVLRTLSQTRPVERWLLVFDNADDIEAVAPFLPSGNGHVLLTSRNRAWSDHARSLPVDVFTRGESVTHLRHRVESITAEEADQVAEILGDLPLAVATAGAWLAETGVSVSDYLLELERRGPRTLSISQLADYPEPVARTWDLSLNRLQEQSPAAARLLELCSVMAPDISLDLLYSPAMAAVLEPLDPTLSEPMVIGRVTQEINRLALIKLDPNARQIHVHRLVQAVVRDRMSKEQIAAAMRDVHRVLAAARPRREVDDPETWSRYRMLWPHLIPAEATESLQEPVRQLLIDRVRYLWQRGDLDRGRERALEVESAWEGMLAAGPDAATADSLARQLLHLRFNLANILRDLARFEECRALDDVVLKRQRELLGDEHPHTLMTAGGLAADLRALGEYGKALDRDQKTYVSWTKLFGEDHPRTLAASHNLAASYRLTGDFTNSLRLNLDTLERRKATLGLQHPRTLDSDSAVARDLLEAARYAQAATRMEGVRRSCVQALGADSRTALNAQVLLGVALRSAGQPEQAESQFREAEAGLVRRFGSESSDALACRLGHSASLLALDRVPEAEAEIQGVLSVYEQRLGPTHPHTLVCKLNLASALRLKGDHTSALAAARVAAEGLEHRLGPDHPYTLAAMMVLAVLLADEGDLDEAGKLEERAAEGLAQTLGEQHPDTLRCRANLLLTRQEQGSETAAAERQDVIAQLTNLLEAEHPDIATVLGGRRLLRALDPQLF
jgi:MinD-like ATPase involved in chromosome partitioning or flagellar assembly/tetratricopeptide (TPR) repeat protein